MAQALQYWFCNVTFGASGQRLALTQLGAEVNIGEFSWLGRFDPPKLTDAAIDEMIAYVNADKALVSGDNITIKNKTDSLADLEAIKASN